jgi:hypothetical protein
VDEAGDSDLCKIGRGVGVGAICGWGRHGEKGLVIGTKWWD